MPVARSSATARREAATSTVSRSIAGSANGVGAASITVSHCRLPVAAA
jgi:hypothetical protein